MTCVKALYTMVDASINIPGDSHGALTTQNACLSTVFSGGVYMAPIIVPIEPTKLTPRTTHGFAAMMRNVKPLRNMARAASAVIASPPPVYWKDSLRYDISLGERPSRVSRFMNAFTATTVPATVACRTESQVSGTKGTYCKAALTAVIPNLVHASV